MPGRVFALFGKSRVRLACSVACGLSALWSSCHWARTPQARFLLWPTGDTGWKRQQGASVCVRVHARVGGLTSCQCAYSPDLC